MSFFFLNVIIYFRHSRAYLHALFKSDTAAMHHITIHNIAYQVSIRKILQANCNFGIVSITR